MYPDILNLLGGGDLRSIGGVAAVVSSVKEQTRFDALIAGMTGSNRLIAMRGADALRLSLCKA